MTDTQLYGNTYGLDDYMTDLTDAIFKVDIGGSVNTMRQNLQVEYTKRLAAIIGNKDYDNVSQSMVLYELKRIDRMASNSSGNTLSKAHKTHIRQIVKDALES
jgi:hypothetical protein